MAQSQTSISSENATLVDSAFPAASTTCTLQTERAAGIQGFDRATLWYQNIAFDYIVPGASTTVEFDFFAHGTGTVHSITVNGTTYSHTETNPLGESSTDVASALASAMTGDPYVSATGSANAVILTVLPAHDGVEFSVSASDGNAPATMLYTSPAFVATQLVNQVNATNWASANTPHALIASTSGAALTVTAARYGTATVSGTTVTIPTLPATVFSGITPGEPIFLAGTRYTVASIQSPTQLTLTTAATSGTGIAWVAPRGGHDGNLIQIYSLSKTGTLNFDQPTYQLSGGSSNVTWNITIDFTSPIDSLRQCWLTFAPALTTGAYVATEWTATFSNWQLTGPTATQQLQVAGPGSIRIEQSDTACTYTGTWAQESGFFSKYFANVTSDSTASVTIAYVCQFTHDLWIGTSLYSDRANASVNIDGDTATLVCQLATDTAIATRRQVKTGIAPGRHTVRIAPSTSGFFYFNFLEAVVASTAPAALTPRTGISPALDFDTNHSYQLPPARLMWMMDQLGYAGPMNEYLGVFWWNERKQIGATLSTAVITIGGTFSGGESVLMTVNATPIGKSVFPEDTPSTIALHFAALINGEFVGLWASATGPVLTITGRSAGPDYTVTITDLSVVPPTGGTTAGTATLTTAPQPGADGTWAIDDTISPPINRAVRDWHADLYAQCAARSREIVTSCSMELVNPPASGYAAMFPDGTPVTTNTDFGGLFSTQCAVGAAKVLAYQKAVYRCIAGMQSAAGLTPCLQYGEFLWWYTAQTGGGMGFYDPETTAAALTSLGRALHVFTGQNDDPTINSSADATFLRNRLRDHVAALVADIRGACPTAICELLWPYDVNYPTTVPGSTMGGQLNYFVNLPVEWQTQSTSGLDRMKVEALSFVTGLRNLDLARQAIELFPGFGWPVNRVRYLAPTFGSACPWVRELTLAVGAGLTTNNLWAFDHVCLFNLQVPEGPLERRSFGKAA